MSPQSSVNDVQLSDRNCLFVILLKSYGSYTYLLGCTWDLNRVLQSLAVAIPGVTGKITVRTHKIMSFYYFLFLGKTPQDGLLLGESVSKSCTVWQAFLVC